MAECTIRRTGEGAPLPGGPQATLRLLRVAQRAGQSVWKADRRDHRRAASPYAQVLEELSDVHFPTLNKSRWSKTI
jgi:hypothetical protein